MAYVGSAAAGTVLAGVGSGSSANFTATPSVTSLTLAQDPTTAFQATTKQYVDNAITAVNPATSVVAASTGALTVTYLNGVSGVGATLTNAGAQAAFQIDGQSLTINQRVLIKDQSSTFQNGVYTVTVVGTGATNWVLTRALDYDKPSDINNTGVINVLNGTVNALTGWLINSSVTTVGTDAITYTKYNNAPGTVTQYDVIVGGANSTLSSVGPGSAGQVLQSGGNAANPAYSTATYPATATGTGTILRADGTNWVATTSTYPNTNAINTIMYASSANVNTALATATTAVLTTSSGVPTWASNLSLTLGGTNASLTASNGGIFYSTASAGAILAGTATAGQLLTSGASTTPAWTTSTYPSTNAVSTLLYASSANVMGALATANNGTLITSGTGVPSISSTLPSAVQGNITSTGTLGNQLNSTRTCFLVYQSGNENNVTGDGTAYTVTYSNSSFDQGSNMNAGTGIFTAPVTGRYLFVCNVGMGVIGAGHTKAYLNFAGSAFTNLFVVGNIAAMRDSDNNFSTQSTQIIPMTSGDTMKITIQVFNSTKTIVLLGNNAETSFSGYLLA